MNSDNTYNSNELNELRNQWQCLNSRIDKLSQRLTDREIRTTLSSRDRLMRQQKLIGIVSLVSVSFCSPLHFEVGFPLWFSIVLAFYFLLMGFLSFRLYSMTGKFIINQLNINEAIDKVYHIKNFRRKSQLLGISLALPIVCYMLWMFGRLDEAVFTGGLCGAVIGLIIGLRADYIARKCLSSMKSELEEMASDYEP